MPRPPKSHTKDARSELLADARKLILSRGYANTSVDAINRHAGLSKGTFYHYFKSKSQLLDAVVEQLTNEGWTRSKAAIEGPEGDALQRFRRFLKAARRWRIVALPQTAEIMRAVFLPENSLLREKIRQRSIDIAVPGLTDLIQDGVAEGVFEVEDPEASARMLMILAYGVSDDQMREVMTSDLPDEDLLVRLTARGQAFLRAVEALLGIPRSRLGEPEVDLLAGMVRAFRVPPGPQAPSESCCAGGSRPR